MPHDSSSSARSLPACGCCKFTRVQKETRNSRGKSPARAMKHSQQCQLWNYPSYRLLASGSYFGPVRLHPSLVTVLLPVGICHSLLSRQDSGLDVNLV